MSASNTGGSRWRTWRQWTAPGHAHIQEGLVEEESAARRIRTYQDTIVPGLLQTERYATAVLRACVGFIAGPDDTEGAVAGRMKRQEILHSDAHKLTFLLAEQALYTTVGDDNVMREQLVRLNGLAGSGPEIGVVPRDAAFIYTTTGFALHDQRQASVETVSACLTITAPDELEYYEKMWSALHQQAVFGEPARDLITAAIAFRGADI